MAALWKRANGPSWCAAIRRRSRFKVVVRRQPNDDDMTTSLPGLHAIALPTPFEIGDVNIYLAEGDTLTLIDCGLNTEAAYTALTDGLATRGYKIRDIKRLLITHHHVDHVGLARRILDESGAEVWCHADCVHWLETPDEARDHFARYFDVVFRESGVPQAAIDVMAQVEL